MKSAALERQQNQLDSALTTLEQGIVKFSTFAKLYMMKGQIHEDRKETAKARETYAKGVKACPKSVPLWILSSRLEEKAGVAIKARSLLEKARLLNPKDAELWEETVRVEERAGSAAQSKTMLARGAIFSPYPLSLPLSLTPFLFLFYRSPGVPFVRPALGHLDLERAAPAAQDAVGRRAQEDKRRPGRHRRRRPALLVGAQNRAREALVRTRD